MPVASTISEQPGTLELSRLIAISSDAWSVATQAPDGMAASRADLGYTGVGAFSALGTANGSTRMARPASPVTAVPSRANRAGPSRAASVLPGPAASSRAADRPRVSPANGARNPA